MHNARLCIHAEDCAINQLRFDGGVAGACFGQDLRGLIWQNDLQLNELVEKALTTMDLNDEDAENAPHLLDVVMQNCRGRVDACIGIYINLALTRSVLCFTERHACSRILRIAVRAGRTCEMCQHFAMSLLG